MLTKHFRSELFDDSVVWNTKNTIKPINLNVGSITSFCLFVNSTIRIDRANKDELLINT
jgi:hypothetical protein